MINHLHIGAGQLGLGFVCELSLELGFSLSVVNRKSTAYAPRLLSTNSKFRHHKPDGRFREFEGFKYMEYDPINSTSSINEPGFTLINNADIISVAIGMRNEKDKEQVCKFLYRGFKSNGINKRVILIAFENLEDNSSKIKKRIIELARLDSYPVGELNEMITPINTITDRICVFEDKDFPYELTVWVEDEAEVILHDPKNEASTLFNLNGEKTRVVGGKKLIFVEQDDIFEGYEKRKMWLVNTSHLGLAAVTHYYGLTNLAECLNRKKGAEVFLRGLQAEMMEFLVKYYGERRLHVEDFERKNIQEFGEQLIQRFKINPKDDLLRILTDLKAYEEVQKLKPTTRRASRLESLKSLFGKLDDRLAYPLREIAWKYPEYSSNYISYTTAELIGFTRKFITTSIEQRKN